MKATKLSKLQKAVLKIGLESLWVVEPIDSAMMLARNEWNANPTFRIPFSGTRGDYRPSEYIGFKLAPLLVEFFKVADEDEYFETGFSNRDGSNRRERFAKAKASISRAMKRLTQRGLIEKTSYHKWRLTPTGEQIASVLFPDTPKATPKQIEAARLDGAQGPEGWRQLLKIK